jgi:hypothetical protein
VGLPTVLLALGRQAILPQELQGDIMAQITLKDRDLGNLIPRYKAIASKVSNLAFEINQMINRLEPSLMASGDIDIRLTSTRRTLQNGEERVNTLASQITLAMERFAASDRRLMIESNELIYEFKQILHQIKRNHVIASPDPVAIKGKAAIDGMFEAKSQIDSVKLEYIADIAHVKPIGEAENGNI